jgi:hypothetical protein
MGIYWIPVIAIVGGVTMIIVIALAGSQTKQRQMQLRSDVQMKLIERFGNADEFVRFIQSDEGRRFLGDAPKATRKAAISGVRSGIVLSFIGVAFLLCAVTERDADWFIPAFILLGLGAGFLVSAYLSMKLAREIDKNVEP